MKKIFFPLFIIVFMLAACNASVSQKSSNISITKIDDVPKKVQEAIDPNAKLQKLNTGTERSYLVYFSNGDVTANFEKSGSMLIVQLEETNPQGDELKQYTFEIIEDNPDIEYFDVQINGESVPLDVVIIGI